MAVLPGFLVIPGILEDRGWSDGSRVEIISDDGTPFTLEERQTERLSPDISTLSPQRYPGWATAWSGTAPIWLRKPTEHYYIEEQDGIAWVRINVARNQKGHPSFKTFWDKEVLPALDHAQKLVVDLRHNPGGNFFHIVPRLERLAGHRLDSPNTLFVVTDGGPTKQIDLTWEDYVTGVDPVYHWIAAQ